MDLEYTTRAGRCHCTGRWTVRGLLVLSQRPDSGDFGDGIELAAEEAFLGVHFEADDGEIGGGDGGDGEGVFGEVSVE